MSGKSSSSSMMSWRCPLGIQAVRCMSLEFGRTVWVKDVIRGRVSQHMDGV